MPAILFICVLGGGFIYGLTAPEKGYSAYENRFLQKKPKFTMKSFKNGDYSKEYEEYVTDQFPFRNSFIALKTRVELLEGKNEIRNVFVSKDDYLIEHKEKNLYESQQGKKNISFLTKFLKEVEQLEHKPNTSVMFVPSSSEILTDKLPAYAPVVNQTAVLDSLKGEFTDKQWVDVDTVLKDREDDYIYYRTDHHWTSLGAYYGYQAWMNHNGQVPNELDSYEQQIVSQNFYGTIHSKVNLNVRPDEITLFQQKGDKVTVDYNMGEQQTDSMYKMDMLKGKDQYGVFFGGNYALIQIKTQVRNNKSIAIIKDSFANSFVPFLVNHYENIYMIDLRSYRGDVKQLVEENKIDDVMVLYELSNFLSDKNIFHLDK